MPAQLGKCLSLFVFGLLLSANPAIEAKELGASLREANRHYHSGNYLQAVAIAEKTLEYSKSNAEAMMIAAMSHFNSRNYSKARYWLRKVIQIKPAHPVARHYIKLLQELEHRFGPFKSDMFRSMQQKDPLVSGEAFKKGWFGHSFPKESAPLKPDFASATVSADSIDHAQVALEVEPPLERVLAEKTVSIMAREAFEKKLYLKSYLFYSQLAAHNPKNRSYLIGKAQAAFHMKRYSEVLKILGPLMLASDDETFNKPDYKKANELITRSRKMIYE